MVPFNFFSDIIIIGGVKLLIEESSRLMAPKQICLVHSNLQRFCIFFLYDYPIVILSKCRNSEIRNLSETNNIESDANLNAFIPPLYKSIISRILTLTWHLRSPLDKFRVKTFIRHSKDYISAYI